MKPILKNIRKIRELKDFDQQYMALQLGISQSQYSKLEKGQKDITLHMLEAIATVLGISRRVLEDFSVAKLFSEKKKKADQDQPCTRENRNTQTMQITWDQSSVEVRRLPIMNYYRK